MISVVRVTWQDSEGSPKGVQYSGSLHTFSDFYYIRVLQGPVAGVLKRKVHRYRSCI